LPISPISRNHTGLSRKTGLPDGQTDRQTVALRFTLQPNVTGVTSRCWSPVAFQHDAFAAERRCACSTAPAAIDRYFLLAGRSAANPPAVVAVVDRWDRQTDRRSTVTNRPWSAYDADSINNRICGQLRLEADCCCCCCGSVIGCDRCATTEPAVPPSSRNSPRLLVVKYFGEAVYPSPIVCCARGHLPPPAFGPLCLPSAPILVTPLLMVALANRCRDIDVRRAGTISPTS